MGFAIVDNASGETLRWSRWSVPPYDNIAESVVESDTFEGTQTELAAARQRARTAIDAATSGAQQQTIEYTIPESGKLNGVDAAGETVALWMIHPAVETYWVDFKTMFDARGAFEFEEFDCTTGRVEIPGTDMPAVFALVATQGSIRRTGWRRLESMFSLASTVADYDAITAAITGA